MELIRISNRLKAVAAMVSKGGRLADIGTDHAYVPIYLCGQERISSAIAMDIGVGPIERAREHIARFGMTDRIETRLSDGAKALEAGEADSILLAGMGGGLAIHILETGREIFASAKEVILQPQSELRKVRIYIERQGYVIDAEDMVFEDGKYYPMMRMHYAPSGCEKSDELFYIYGKYLLAQKHPVLYSYLLKEKKIYSDILEQLDKQEESSRIMERRAVMLKKLKDNQRALGYFGA